MKIKNNCLLLVVLIILITACMTLSVMGVKKTTTKTPKKASKPVTKIKTTPKTVSKINSKVSPSAEEKVSKPTDAPKQNVSSKENEVSVVTPGAVDSSKASDVNSDAGNIKIIVTDPKTNTPLEGVKLYMDGKLVGETDAGGYLYIKGLKFGHYDAELVSQDNLKRMTNGFYVTKKEDSTGLWFTYDSADSYSPGSSSTTPGNASLKKKIIVIAPEVKAFNPNSLVEVSFDSTIPADVQEYVKSYVKQIDPVLRKFLGSPIESSTLTLKYIQSNHTTLSPDKTLMTAGRLPQISSGNDPSWDEVFLVNYIHKYLQGRNLPIQGVRYTENLAHSIKELVAEYMKNEGIRTISFRGLDYYVNAYKALKGLKPETVLNLGNTAAANGSDFDGSNFLLEDGTYNKLNAFTIEYAKAVWLKLAYARFLETGKMDFFYCLLKELYEKDPKTSNEAFSIIKSIVDEVNGEATDVWMSKQALFKDALKERAALSIIPVEGNISNIRDVNNPDYLYPIIMARTPGKYLEINCNITIRDEAGNTVLNQSMTTGFDDNGIKGLRLPKETLKPGKYICSASVEYNGKTYSDEQAFNVYDETRTDGYFIDTKPVVNTRNTKVEVQYDDSIPGNVKDYITKLIAQIDPVIRDISGEPAKNEVLKIKYDPKGLAGMNGNMSVLNITDLPRINSGEDINFDAFFYIEYYHMYHRSIEIPVKNLRYSENISQAMKIALSHYLAQYDLRGTQTQDIPYFTNLNSVLENLGTGVLLNLGPTKGNEGGNNRDIRTLWDSDSKFLMFMNIFTLNYSPTVWMVLADAYYSRTGDYGFFRELQNELSVAPPQTDEEFYNMINRIIVTNIDGKKPGDWLKSTALCQQLSSEDYYIRPLPVKGSLDNILGIDNPNYIYPFVIDRSGAAKILESEITVSIIDNKGAEVFKQNCIPEMEGSNTLKGIRIPDLDKGEYTVVITFNAGGKTYSGKQGFCIK